jgi:hypothetical protein
MTGSSVGMNKKSGFQPIWFCRRTNTDVENSTGCRWLFLRKPWFFPHHKRLPTRSKGYWDLGIQPAENQPTCRLNPYVCFLNPCLHVKPTIHQQIGGAHIIFLCGPNHKPTSFCGSPPIFVAHSFCLGSGIASLQCRQDFLKHLAEMLGNASDRTVAGTNNWRILKAGGFWSHKNSDSTGKARQERVLEATKRAILSGTGWESLGALLNLVKWQNMVGLVVEPLFYDVFFHQEWWVVRHFKQQQVGRI